jgi:hypothetical protein
MTGATSATKDTSYHVPVTSHKVVRTGLYYDKVIKVKGWRSAILENHWGGRSSTTFMFFWEPCGRPWWQWRQDMWRMVFGEPTNNGGM